MKQGGEVTWLLCEEELRIGCNWSGKKVEREGTFSAGLELSDR